MCSLKFCVRDEPLFAINLSAQLFSQLMSPDEHLTSTSVDIIREKYDNAF